MKHHIRAALIVAPLFGLAAEVGGQERDQPRSVGRRAEEVRDEDLPYPPSLGGGQAVVSHTSADFLKPPPSVLEGIAIAEVPPTIDLIFYPGQDYPGKPWSNWGDGSVANGKYYSAIGDHLAIGRGSSSHSTGTALVYEYDPASMRLRPLVNIAELLQLPRGHYTPGKIHSRVDMGRDGWLYYATHRGSPRAASDENHYEGDWILRTNPHTNVSEVVARAPVPKHSLPNGVLDRDRMIYYAGTAAGPDAADQGIQFLAYDIHKRRALYAGGNGPARSMILVKSTGRVYFVPGNEDGEVMRFDASGSEPPRGIGQMLGVRAATEETKQGIVYTVSRGQRSSDAALWEFDTRSETSRQIGTVSVGTQAYVASIDVDPTGRYLYYIPGAHGGADRDGTPVVQYDVKTNRKKVIAFLHPFFQQTYGFTLKGTYSTAMSADGSTLFATFNISRGTRAWDCCGLAVVHIPEVERTP